MNKSKLEVIYNSILLAVTIITIILFPGPICILIKYTYNLIVGLLTPKALGLLLGVELAFFGVFIIPIMITLVLFSIGVHIYLIIKAFRIRKVKERKIKWLDFLYLIILLFFLAIITGFYNHLLFIVNLTMYTVYIEIVLLIIILIKRRKKTDN